MPGQEASQQDLAEVGLLGDDDAYLFGRDPQYAPCCAYPRRQEDALTCQQAHLAQELTGPVVDHQRLVGRADLVDDLDAPVENHDQVVLLVALAEEDLTDLDRDLGAVAAKGVELRLAEERALVGRVRGRRGRDDRLRRCRPA